MHSTTILPPSPVEADLLQYFGNSPSVVIFDIGSCDGVDSVRYHELLPQATIYAFEPIPENFAKIAANIQRAGAQNKIKSFEIAMSNTTGEASINVSSGAPGDAQTPQGFTSQSSSLLAPDQHLELFPWCRFDTRITVPTDTIQHFCIANNIPSIDFIHLDVQGAELMVLEGAGEMLTHVNSIWLEVENVSLYKNQPLRTHVESFMEAAGFVLVKSRTGGFSGDQFYLNKEFIRQRDGSTSLMLLSLRSALLRNSFYVNAKRMLRKVKFYFKK